MARIRTIKPEFQNSQSMGRVSRDARLLFIELWPQCDDAGRIRANSRMLASVLFPYDADAQSLIDGWLSELEKENCVIRYRVDQDEYLQVCHWEHQKIDHPQPSKLPAHPGKKTKKTKLSPREGSRSVENISEEPTNVRAVSRTVPEGIRIVSEGKVEAPAVADAVAAYNVIAAELSWPLVQTITPKRSASIRKRLDECGGLEGWRLAMGKARASPFLRGETGRANGHESWTPDLDFFLQQSAFTKLMEGKYDQRGGASKPAGFDALRTGAARAAGVDGERGPGMAPEGDSLRRLAIPAGR